MKNPVTIATTSLLASLLFTSATFALGTSKPALLIVDTTVTKQWGCFGRSFSSYDSWRKMIEGMNKKSAKSPEQFISRMAIFDKKFTRGNYELYKSNLECRNFIYQVDGHPVMGYVIKPNSAATEALDTGVSGSDSGASGSASPEQKLPVLVYNRGGNGNYGGVSFATQVAGLFPIANEGFIIIGSQYRGTYIDESTIDDEFGGADVNDVARIVELIPSIDGADVERVGMFGDSRGGMQTHLYMKHQSVLQSLPKSEDASLPPKVKAIAISCGVSDLAQGLVERPNMINVHKKRIPKYVENQQAELAKRSVLTWVDKLDRTIPILLQHGIEDKRVSVNQAKTLATALEQHNIPHKLVLYPSGDHSFTQNREQNTAETVAWFKHYL